MRVSRRGTPDPSGRYVDIHVRPELITVIAIDNSELVTEDAIFSTILQVLREIRESTSRSIRERAFTVLTCRWRTRTGGDHVGIGLPRPFDSRVFALFHVAIGELSPIIDMRSSDTVSVNAKPALRYEHGVMVVYVDPFDETSNISAFDDAELRSAEFREVRRRVRATASQLPTISGSRTLEHRYSIAELQSVTETILRMIYDMRAAGTFTWLRRQIQHGLGIRVVLREESMIGRHGTISAGWILDEGSEPACSATISINRALPESLRYVVLSHELAHFALHFPVLLLGQLVDQLAWRVPARQAAFNLRMAECFNTLAVFEEDANEFASLLLAPPRLDPEWVTSILYEAGARVEPGEVIWRLLQGLFPETQAMEYSWHNYTQMRARARRETGSILGINSTDAGSLYEAMLSAAISRDTAVSRKRREGVNEGIDLLLSSAHRFLAEDVAATVDLPSESESLTGTLDAYIDSPVLMSPLGPVEGVPTPRLPLVPFGSPNVDRWQSVLHPNSPPASLETWAAQHPRDSIMLYPNRSVPDGPVLI